MIAREWQAGLGVSGALEELMGSGARLDLLGDDQAQVSLRAMLAVGYDHLPDDDSRQAFRQLGVFGGQPRTFTWMAAADIWELARRPAQKHIATLVDQQMIQPLGDGVYSLHNSFADFALSLLTEADEKTAVYDRFVDHYIHLVTENVESDWQEVEDNLSQIRHAFDWLAGESRLGAVTQLIQLMNRP